MKCFVKRNRKDAKKHFLDTERAGNRCNSHIVLCFRHVTNQTVTVLGCSKTCDNLILKTNNAALRAEDLLLSPRAAEAVTPRVTAAAARCPLTCRSIRASPKDPAAVGMRLTRVRLTTARNLCTIFKTPVNTCQLQCSQGEDLRL